MRKEDDTLGRQWQRRRLLSPPQNANDEEDLEGLEELIALEEEEERQEQQEGSHSVRSSEAEVLTNAQRIVLELNNDNRVMPQFAEAATSLKELGSPLLMAKLDANRHTKAASTLGIKVFPTSLLFVNGTSQAYTGGLSAEEIVIWARKKTGVPLIKIRSVAEADKFLKKYHTFVIGLFEKFEGHDYDEFVKAAISDNKIQFVETSNIDVATVLFPDIKETKHFLGIVKSKPGRYTPYGGGQIVSPQLDSSLSTVKDHFIPRTRIWNKELINQNFLTWEAESIQSILVSYYLMEDLLIWPRTTDGSYSVKSAYQLLSAKNRTSQPSSSNTEAVLVDSSLATTALFSMVAWSIWIRRNKIREKQQVWGVGDTVQQAQELLQEFWDVQGRPSRPLARRTQQKWSSPGPFYNTPRPQFFGGYDIHANLDYGFYLF
nr:protein disulfide isomerase-like 1-6 [Quercus suber]